MLKRKKKQESFIAKHLVNNPSCGDNFKILGLYF